MRRGPVVAVAYAFSAMALAMSVSACFSESSSHTTATGSSSSTSIPPPAPTGVETSELPRIASVTGIVPMSGPRGSHVTITGTDFIGARAVCFGPSPSPDFQVNASCSQITAVVPTGSGTVRVTVVKKVGISAANASGDTFTYSGSAVASGAAPSVSSASPCEAATPEPSP